MTDRPIPEAPVRISAQGTPENLHSHLDPVVEAELSWGNKLAERWYVDRRVGTARVQFRKPFAH